MKKYNNNFIEACLKEGIQVFDMDMLYDELSDKEAERILKGKVKTVDEFRVELREVIDLVNEKKRLPARLKHLVNNYLGFEGETIKNEDILY